MTKTLWTIAVVLAYIATPVTAQSAREFKESTRELMELNRELAGEMISRNQQIVTLFDDVTDEGQIETAYDEATEAIEEAIALYGTESDLWLKFTEVEAIIDARLENARERAATDARWQTQVEVWQQNLDTLNQQKVELETEVIRAGGLLERIQDDRDLVIDIMYSDSVQAAQEMIQSSIEDFRAINDNMTTIVDTMDERFGTQGL